MLFWVCLHVCLYVWFLPSIFLSFSIISSASEDPYQHMQQSIMEKTLNSEPKVYFCHLKPLTSYMWCRTNNLFFLNLSYLICKMWIMISLPTLHTVTVRTKCYNIWPHKHLINYSTIKMGLTLQTWDFFTVIWHAWVYFM